MQPERSRREVSRPAVRRRLRWSQRARGGEGGHRLPTSAGPPASPVKTAPSCPRAWTAAGLSQVSSWPGPKAMARVPIILSQGHTPLCLRSPLQPGRSFHLNALELKYYKYSKSPCYEPGTGHRSWLPSGMAGTRSCPLPRSRAGTNEKTNARKDKS